MVKSKLLLLGGNVICLRYVRAAQEMGLEVICADMNPDSPAFSIAEHAEAVSIADPDACLEVAQRHGIDAVVAINDFGVMSAAFIAQKMGLPGLPLEVAELALDKRRMRETWEQAGLSTLQYRRVRSAEELKVAVDELGHPLIIKPCNSKGGGSRGVRLLEPDDDLSEIYDFANCAYQDHDLLLERFVTGLEHSVEVIVYQGQSHIVAISDKVKSPLPYRVDDIILYPTVEEGDRLAQLEDCVAAAVKSIGIEEGIAHVELSITEQGPVLFELGARCGGGAPDPLVPYLSGVNEFKEAVRLALGQPPEKLAPVHQKGCVIRFFYPPPGEVVSIHGLEEAACLPGILFLHLFVKPGDEVRPLKTCGDRAGMVIAGAETRDQALDIANQVLQTVKIRTKPLIQ